MGRRLDLELDSIRQDLLEILTQCLEARRLGLERESAISKGTHYQAQLLYTGLSRSDCRLTRKCGSRSCAFLRVHQFLVEFGVCQRSFQCQYLCQL